MSIDQFKSAGNAAFKEKKYEQAIEQYTKALGLMNAKDEASAALFSNRSASHSSIGQHQQALADAELCIACKPAWVKGHFRKGVALEALGNLPDSEKAYESALNTEPSNGDIQDRLNNIRAMIKKTMSKTPQQCKDSNELKLIGNYHFKEARYERAMEYYNIAIDQMSDKDPNKINCYNNRAACSTQIHNYPMVIADCSAVLELDPNNQKALLRRAYAYKGLEKWKLAINDFQAVAPSPQVSQEIARLRGYLN